MTNNAKSEKDTYSATIRMNPELFKRFKGVTSHFKKRGYDTLFTIPDLIDAVCSLPIKTLETEVDKVMAKKSAEVSANTIKLNDLSESAKAKIAAILAEEAAKKG